MEKLEGERVRTDCRTLISKLKSWRAVLLVIAAGLPREPGTSGPHLQLRGSNVPMWPGAP